jgi:hypothetical protein
MSRGSSRRSSSTTLPTPRVRVPRHVARLVTQLVVDYFTYAAHPVASARRAACRVAHRRLLCLVQARRRLLRLCRASRGLGTSHGSSRGSSSTPSTTPRVQVPRQVARLIAPLVTDYFASAARPGASARRAAHHAARRRLLRLRRASKCLGTSRGSSSTTSTTPHVQLLWHVAQHVVWFVALLVVDYNASHRLVVDYFTYAARPGVSARHAARRRQLRLRRASRCLGSSRGSSRRS